MLKLNFELPESETSQKRREKTGYKINDLLDQIG